MKGIDPELLNRLKNELDEDFRLNLVPYWTRFARDDLNGGFMGRITWDNQKDYNAHKGGILHARYLWAFSAAWRRYKLPELKQAAHDAFAYFKNHFIDEEFGGFFWMLDAKGAIVDDKKHIYTQAFGIYGLMEYYAAFGDGKALELAHQIYHLIEDKAVDSKHGGYLEAFNRDWTPVEDTRLSKKDKNTPKSMNTHLHMLEAYTNLYRHRPTDALKTRLTRLIRIFCDHIINLKRTSLICFMDTDWTPLSGLISYGHNIETSWLLAEAAEVLKDKLLIDETKTIALKLAEAVLNEGVDSNGGLINERIDGEMHDPDKDWWPQAEAVVGFIHAYQITGNICYLHAATNCWKFIQNCMIDHTYGEWFEKTDRNGKAFSTMDKVRSWKGPYHNMRMVLEVVHRVDSLLAGEGERIPAPKH